MAVVFGAVALNKKINYLKQIRSSALEIVNNMFMNSNILVVYWLGTGSLNFYVLKIIRTYGNTSRVRFSVPRIKNSQAQLLV